MTNYKIKKIKKIRKTKRINTKIIKKINLCKLQHLKDYLIQKIIIIKECFFLQIN